MYLVIGLVIVALSVFTGYTLSHGEWAVLFQPAEFIIILGCGLGAFFGSQTKYTFGLIVKSLKHLFADPGSSKGRYLETLALLYALFSKMHREGVISIESDVEKPESSPIFSKYPNISKDSKVVNFIGDTLRVYLTTGDPADIDSLMDVDINTMREEGILPAHAVSHMAESMPGMGIVACVLGVVLAMGKINEPPEILGHYRKSWATILRPPSWAPFSVFCAATGCSVPWVPSWKTTWPKNIFIIIRSRRPWLRPFGVLPRSSPWSTGAGPFPIPSAPPLRRWKNASRAARAVSE